MADQKWMRVRPTNQPSSPMPSRCHATKENIASFLGYHPNSITVQEVFDKLSCGEIANAYTTAIPKEKGTDGVAYSFEPVAEGEG